MPNHLLGTVPKQTIGSVGISAKIRARADH
jgi:hypothetical protein